VAKLEGLSFTNLLATLLGDKVEKLSKEKAELAAAKLKYDERLEATQSLASEAREIERELDAFGGLDQQHHALMRDKEQLLLTQPGKVAARLTELADRIGDAKSDADEIGEALVAGDTALQMLRQVADDLRSASNWGTFDMMGGGLVSTMVKHGKINSARTAANRAQRALRKLSRELEDVHLRAPIQIEVGGMMTFADYVFDGFFVDWMVQSKIRGSRDRVDRAQREVTSVLSELRRHARETARHIEELAKTREDLVAES